ncbi:hypothetical protein BH23GEM3_BH23GEM3_20230 [soil metagenome]|nr:transposase [Gemmatimonadota bacterium]
MGAGGGGKAAPAARAEYGYRAAHKVKGRKRHLVTDTLGLLLAVLVTSASTQERDAAIPAMELAKAKVPGIQMLYVDGGYAGARLAGDPS